MHSIKAHFSLSTHLLCEYCQQMTTRKLPWSQIKCFYFDKIKTTRQLKATPFPVELSHLNLYNPSRFFLLAVRPKIILSINELSECKHTAKFQKMIQKTMKWQCPNWMEERPRPFITARASTLGPAAAEGGSLWSLLSPLWGGGGARWHKEGGEWGREGVLCVCVFWGEGSLQTGAGPGWIPGGIRPLQAESGSYTSWCFYAS